MRQRAVVLVAGYLSKRPMGRIVRVKPLADGDYVVAIEDCRDRRVQLIRSVEDLRVWIESFDRNECPEPVGAICGVCDHVHTDRDLDGELFGNCIGCQAELIEVAIELGSEGEAWS